MKEELDGLLSSYEKYEEKDNYYLVKDAEKEVYVILGGIGKASMAFTIGKFLALHKVDMIINTGVAGVLFKALKPLDIFVATKSAYYDVDVLAFGYKRGQMCSQPLYYDCLKDGVDFLMSKNDPSIKRGLIISGDTFITKDNTPKDLEKDFDHPVAIDMESASVGQCANIEKLPYMIIRAISDDTENEGNKDVYDKLLKEASNKAGKLTAETISYLSSK